MGVVERNSELFEQVLRLRRAERSNPDDEDIVAVRAALERQLGDVLTRSMAARLLDLHHSSLQRWIDSGDLPVVLGADGRKGVPVDAVAALREHLDQGSARDGHRIERVMAEAHRRAEALGERLRGASAEAPDPHTRAQRRSLAYHRAVADELGQTTIDAARHRVWQWRDEGRMDPRYATAWLEILDRPATKVRRAISEDSQEMADLRQSSPFAGTLSEAERRKIWELVA